jgi:hypothetical protein
MPLIGLLALPGAAQFQPRELFITPERLWNIPGVRHIASSLKVMICYSTGRGEKVGMCIEMAILRDGFQTNADVT